MALISLNDITRWHAQQISWISIFYSANTVSNTTLQQLTLSNVISADSSFSLRPVYSPTRSGRGAQRAVAWKMDLTVTVLQNNFPDYRETLDNIFYGGLITDLDVRFSGDDGSYNFSFDTLPEGQTIHSDAEIKTGNDGIPLLTIKVTAVVKLKTFTDNNLII